MKQKTLNKIIEIAISDYKATSFGIKLEMWPQKKLDTNIAGETSELLLLNKQKNETQIQKQNQAENFESDLI